MSDAVRRRQRGIVHAPPSESPIGRGEAASARRRRRGVLADATIGAGATILLLQSTSASTRGVALTVAGVALVVVGLALLWGVPRPSFRLRMVSSLAGLLFGYAVVAPEGPATWLAVAGGVVMLAGLLARRSMAPKRRPR